MKRLYLLRHAKSGWDNPAQDDFDRPLSRRGRRSAPLMGRYMRNLGYAPSIALCSPARRTQETWDLVRDALDSGTAEEMRPELYHPGAAHPARHRPDAIDDAHESAIVISHNPGILTLALGLIGSGVVSATRSGNIRPPPSPVFDFAVDSWRDVYPGQGRLIGFTRPKELDSAA
jgi:phosphohistidine phosphatase